MYCCSFCCCFVHRVYFTQILLWTWVEFLCLPFRDRFFRENPINDLFFLLNFVFHVSDILHQYTKQLLDQVNVLKTKTHGLCYFYQWCPTSEIYDNDIIGSSFPVVFHKINHSYFQYHNLCSKVISIIHHHLQPR